MRDLTTDEKSLLERRQAGQNRFLDERMPVLSEFMESLGQADAALVLVDAGRFLKPLDEWLSKQEIIPEIRSWITTRLGYFSGEYLCQRLGGRWFLNEDPGSKYFARYVVGKFSKASNDGVVVDPFVVAQSLVAESQGRSIAALLSRVETEILTHL